jgi:hypothetical protein
MLMRKVHGPQLASVMLSSADYFVLDLMVQNMEDRQMEQVMKQNLNGHLTLTSTIQVLDEIEKKVKKRRALKLGKLSDSLPSVIIDEAKIASAPRAGSDSSGFGGSSKGHEQSKVDQQRLYPRLLGNSTQL